MDEALCTRGFACIGCTKIRFQSDRLERGAPGVQYLSTMLEPLSGPMPATVYITARIRAKRPEDGTDGAQLGNWRINQPRLGVPISRTGSPVIIQKAPSGGTAPHDSAAETAQARQDRNESNQTQVDLHRRVAEHRTSYGRFSCIKSKFCMY